MDREALVLRNRRMAEAFHTLPFKHRVRRAMLRSLAALPISTKRSDEERILLIRPDHLGDTLLTTPAIRALRTARPKAQIHALVGPWSADILANYPEIDAVLTLPFPGFSRSPKASLRSPYEQAWRSARHLRQVGYSSAVILRPDHWWGAMLAYLAGIPTRIGYDLPDVAPFLTEAIAFVHQHAVMQNLRLLEGWTGSLSPEDTDYSFAVDDELDRAYIDSYLQEWGIDHNAAILCIHPGSGTWVKLWNEGDWATVADTLGAQLEAAVVFTGSEQEKPTIRAITDQMRRSACVIAGDTDVFQLAALYQRASVVLGPDSGPLHLAVAAGTPTVALFGPADPVEFAPWGPPDKHVVLATNIGCRPCRVLDWSGDDPANHPCVKEISVGAVLDAARRVANRE